MDVQSGNFFRSVAFSADGSPGEFRYRSSRAPVGCPDWAVSSESLSQLTDSSRGV